MTLAETISGVENRRWWLVYVFVLPLTLLWNMWKIKIIDLMTFHLWIFLQNGGMFMKVKSPGMLFNTIIIYICLSFQRGFPPLTWAEPGSTPRLPPFPCIPQTSAAPNKLWRSTNSIRSVGKQLQQQQQLREGFPKKSSCSFGFCPNEEGGPCPNFLSTFHKLYIYWVNLGMAKFFGTLVLKKSGTSCLN